MGIAFYLNNPFEKKIVVEDKTVEAKVNENGEVVKDRKKVLQEKVKSEEAKELNKSKYAGVFKEGFTADKCKDSAEYLCNMMNDKVEPPWGVLPQGKILYFFTDIRPHLYKAKELLGLNAPAQESATGPALSPPDGSVPPPTYNAAPSKPAPALKFTDDDVYKLASILYLMDGLKPDTRLDSYVESNFVFGFYNGDSAGTLVSIIELSPVRIQGLRLILNPRRLSFMKERGMEVLDFTKDFFLYIPVGLTE